MHLPDTVEHWPLDRLRPYLQDTSYGKVVGSGAVGPSINAPAPQAGSHGDATAPGATATAGPRRRAVFTE